MAPAAPSRPTAAQADDGQRPTQTDNHVDLQGMTAPAAQADAGAQAAQVAADQHDIGGSQRDVCASRSHGYPDRPGFQCERVVDAIPHHQRTKAVLYLGDDPVQLVLRQGLRLHVADTHLLRQRIGDCLAVAGQQKLPVQAQCAQLGQRRGSLGRTVSASNSHARN